jgi:MFS transporter, DHA1 family, multidrug resistance protein
VSWRLIKVLLLVLFSYLFTTMLRPVFLVFLQDEFTQNVLLLALGFLPATLLESFLPSHLGRLSDRWGRRPLIIAGLTWVGLMSICLPIFANFAWVIVFWALKTLGLAAALLPQKAMIHDLTADTNRGTGYGLYTFASSLGAAGGPLLGGWMYEAIGHATPFFFAGIVCLVSLCWVSLLWPRS